MPNPFVIDFGVDTTEGAFADYTRRQISKLEEALLEEVNAINEMMAEDLRAAYSGGVVQRRTGAAADSVKVIPAERDGDEITGSVQAGGDSAPEVEFLEVGTKPHVIYATNPDGVLAFEFHGEMMFRRYIFHPGTRAYGIFESLEQEAPGYEEDLQRLPEYLFG